MHDFPGNRITTAGTSDTVKLRCSSLGNKGNNLGDTCDNLPSPGQESPVPHHYILDTMAIGFLHGHLLTVGSHMPGKMVALPEMLMANRASEKVFSSLLRMWIGAYVLPFVMGPHVEDQVSCQAEG